MGTERNLDSLDAFKEAVDLRIKTPQIANLYRRFQDAGLEEASWKVISDIPETERVPLLYTLTVHVTKEKPVFIYAIGKHYRRNIEKLNLVAVSTDLLWALSLMLDDVVDNDTQRAGQDSTWTIFGKENIRNYVMSTLGIFYEKQAQEISPAVANLLRSCVEDGIRSLYSPQVHSIDSSEEDILYNIDQRARFHCEYPIKAIFEGDPEHEEQSKLAMEGLFASNRAGQIINDVKDLVPSNLYGRPLFSDIIGGTTTVPLSMMMDVLKGADRRFIYRVFNSKESDQKTLDDLEGIISANLPRARIHRKISDIYEYFTDIMRVVTDEDGFDVCQEWSEYKLTQADRLLLGH